MTGGERLFQWMMVSWLMSGRIASLSGSLRLALQAVLAVAAIVMVYRVFCRSGDWRLQVSLLFAANLVAGPKGSNYDMGMISVASIYLVWAAVENGRRRGKMGIVAACWQLPLIVMPLNAFGAPLFLTRLLICLCRRLNPAASHAAAN